MITSSTITPAPGISGFAIYLPPYRIRLEDWCQWTGNSWDKIGSVIGRSFRMLAPNQTVYALAANAVLKLIDQYQIDPAEVGYLALATESSTDNSAGAIIVRGLLDQALLARGRAPLARDCEVPEIKHACLAGLYAVKAAQRYLAYDGATRKAIVVSADIAEYARGSSGEPTQGCGAVAMLMESNPKLLQLDLHTAGSASEFRLSDFRKPFLRFHAQTPSAYGRLHDHPAFNGKYSTACYTEATLKSLDNFFGKRSGPRAQYIRDLGAVFLHRPYRHMPISAWTLGYLFALAADGGAGHEELAGYCDKARLKLEDVLAEMAAPVALGAMAREGRIVNDAYPLSSLVSKAFRESETFKRVVTDKMRLGADGLMETGNLYSAALPAWIAAGLEQAERNGLDLLDKELLLVGYGSGDASEAVAARLVPGWEAAAAKIGFAQSLDGAVDVGTEQQYADLHDGLQRELPPIVERGFFVERVGSRKDDEFTDYGIEYYRYVES